MFVARRIVFITQGQQAGAVARMYSGLPKESQTTKNLIIRLVRNQYPDQMKARFEEEITKDVVDYMIYGTIMALRLDTTEKVNAYLGIYEMFETNFDI